MAVSVLVRGHAVISGDVITRAYALRAAKRIAAERKQPAIVMVDGVKVYTARPEVSLRRKAKDCPAVCHGAYAHQHSIACRPARPRCRWRRKANGLCHCDRYPYPHRDGSGHCGNEEAYIKHLQTPRYRGVA